MGYSEMMMNILSLLCVDGYELEMEGYPGGEVDVLSTPFNRSKYLGHMNFRSKFYDMDCRRGLYVDYSSEWVDEFTNWIEERYDLSSLREGDEDGSGSQTWVFRWECVDGKVEFRDEVQTCDG